MISLGFAPSFDFDRSRLKEAMCCVSAHHHDHVRTLYEVVQNERTEDQSRKTGRSRLQ